MTIQGLLIIFCIAFDSLFVITGLTLCYTQVSSRQKETSSTSGMRESVETSLLLQHRAKVRFSSGCLMELCNLYQLFNLMFYFSVGSCAKTDCANGGSY